MVLEGLEYIGQEDWRKALSAAVAMGKHSFLLDKNFSDRACCGRSLVSHRNPSLVLCKEIQ